jgi:hypothetical protein
MSPALYRYRNDPGVGPAKSLKKTFPPGNRAVPRPVMGGHFGRSACGLVLGWEKPAFGLHGEPAAGGWPPQIAAARATPRTRGSARFRQSRGVGGEPGLVALRLDREHPQLVALVHDVLRELQGVRQQRGQQAAEGGLKDRSSRSRARFGLAARDVGPPGSWKISVSKSRCDRTSSAENGKACQESNAGGRDEWGVGCFSPATQPSYAA